IPEKRVDKEVGIEPPELHTLSAHRKQRPPDRRASERRREWRHGPSPRRPCPTDWPARAPPLGKRQSTRPTNASSAPPGTAPRPGLSPRTTARHPAGSPAPPGPRRGWLPGRVPALVQVPWPLDLPSRLRP